MDRETHLAITFAGIARRLLAADDLDEILQDIVGTAVSEVTACESAGIELIEKQVIRPIAPSNKTAERVSRLQSEVGEGPCLSAIREHETFQTDDLGHDSRWPTFGPRAERETGVRSILGFRLFAEEDTMGALNLYSSQPAAFDDKAVAIGSILAAHAAVAMAAAREREYMHTAIENRDTIGQAKGILMARYGIGPDQAFELLRKRSQGHNVKVREVAEQVINSNETEG